MKHNMEEHVHPTLNDALHGKRVHMVARVGDADEGLVIHFDGGDVLSVGWSGCEGTAALNGERVDCPGTLDDSEA